MKALAQNRNKNEIRALYLVYKQILKALRWKWKFDLFELWGPVGQKRGLQTKKFQQIWNQNPKIYVILKFEGPRSKNEKFQNFSHFWKFFEKFWSPKSKFRFHRNFCFDLKNTFWKFESSSSKNKKIQNFEHFWQFLKIFCKILGP